MIMFLLLSLLCGFMYYFSYTLRIEDMKTHLTNRALVTANMLDRSNIFDHKLMNIIDSSILISIKHKSIQAYNSNNEKVYAYSDKPADTLNIINDIWMKQGQKITFILPLAKKRRLLTTIIATTMDWL